jgi:hypothetical protein
MEEVTVILENEYRIFYIEKIMTICQLKANFNWMIKHIFAKWMMQRAYAANMVKIEKSATLGIVVINGIIHKQLFYDDVILHINTSLSSTNAANC